MDPLRFSFIQCFHRIELQTSDPDLSAYAGRAAGHIAALMRDVDACAYVVYACTGLLAYLHELPEVCDQLLLNLAELRARSSIQ
jgi:hypothetical protein